MEEASRGGASGDLCLSPRTKSVVFQDIEPFVLEVYSHPEDGNVLLPFSLSCRFSLISSSRCDDLSPLRGVLFF